MALTISGSSGSSESESRNKYLQGKFEQSINPFIGKWFEPRGISYWFVVIFRVRIAFRKTAVGD